MYKLIITGRFSAAHYLQEYPGACARVHGHNWRVTVTVTAPDVDDKGMVVDLVALKQQIDDCLGRFDHRVINEVPPFDRLNPTSEMLAKHLYEEISARVAVQVESVAVSENDDYQVVYQPKS